MNKKVYVDLSQQDVQDIINAYEKDIEKFNKQKEVIYKIKEIINHKAFFDPAMPNCNALGQKATLDILELLKEIE